MDPWKLGSGLLVAGRFEIESLVRSGGVGKLFRAHDRETGGQVALKMLRPPATSDWTPLHFAQEMTRLAGLQHPGLAPHVAHGQTEQGELYVATAWLEGEDLARRLGQRPLRVGETLVLARKLAELLALAHSHGLVHGDLKPSRLFLRTAPDSAPEAMGPERGEATVEGVALLGLGLPRSLLSARTVTGSGEILAHLRYVAPEQVQTASPPGPQADIYSLGCVLFECLVGAPPFTGEHAGIVLAQRLSSEVPPLRQVRPELPESLEKLLAAMMASSTAERLQHGGELVAALAKLDLRPEHLALVPALTSPPLAAGSVGPTGSSPRSNRERRLVSLILAIPPTGRAGARGGTEQAADVDAREQRSSELRRGMAAFGAKVDHLADGSVLATLVAADAARQTATDQVAQAARAAWQLQRLLPEWQVAVATGNGIVAGKQAVGEALRQAATLLDDAAAHPGTVWLDELTADLLDTRFHVRQLGPERWALGGERRGGEEARLLLGRPTPCVGREQELRMLSGVVAGCAEEPRAQAVLLLGPSGMGKSRLRQELVRRLAAQGIELKVAVGRGDLMSAGTAYGLLGQAVLDLCGIAQTGEAEPRRALLVEQVRRRVGVQEAQGVAAFLGELCGLPFPDDDRPQLRAARQDPRLMRDQMTAALLAFLRGECAGQPGRPVLIILEDLHWSDEASVRLVEAVLRELGEQPLIMLGLARPEVKERFPRLWESCPVQELRLGGLGRKASEQLVRAVLGERATAEIVERIVVQAEGHALFLEELIRAVAEGAEELPETVLAMLQARLLRLDARARRVLAAASVFGERFWRGGLMALLGSGPASWPETASMPVEDGRMEVERGLLLLVAAETIARQGESRFAGEAQYTFRHALVRDAAYNLLGEEERRAGHRAAGQYLEALGEREPMVLAEHYLRGGEPERAARYFARAAVELVEGSDLTGALRCVERGLQCGATGEVLGMLHAVAAWAHFWSWNLGPCYEASNQALPLLEAGSAAWCRAVGMMLGTAIPLNRHEALPALTRALLETSPLPGAEGVYLEQLWVVTVGFVIMVLPDAIEAALGRMQEVSARLGESDMRARGILHVARSICGLGEGDFWRHRSEAEAALACFVAAGDRRYQVIAEAYMGLGDALLGHEEAAVPRLRAALDLGRKLGESMMEGVLQTHIAQALLESGRPEALEEAEVLTRTMIANSVVLTFWSAFSYCVLAGVYLVRGELEAAGQAARQAHLIVPAIGPMAAAVLGRALLAQGKLEEARVVVEREQETLASRGGTGFMDIKLHLVAAEVQHALGEPTAARRTLDRAAELIEQRAARIPDETIRESYLGRVRDHVQVRELRRLL